MMSRVLTVCVAVNIGHSINPIILSSVYRFLYHPHIPTPSTLLPYAPPSTAAGGDIPRASRSSSTNKELVK